MKREDKKEDEEQVEEEEKGGGKERGKRGMRRRSLMMRSFTSMRSLRHSMKEMDRGKADADPRGAENTAPKEGEGDSQRGGGRQRFEGGGGGDAYPRREQQTSLKD